MKKHMIWSNIEDIDEFIGDYKAFAADMLDITDEDEIREYAYRLRDDYLDDERMNLNIKLNGEIIVLASLGLWNGRRNGYKKLNSNNIADCLYANVNGCSYCEWYVDSYGNMRGTEHHHDGTNYYEYRELKPNVSAEQLDRALDKCLDGDDSAIKRLTRSIGGRVANVYGWKCRQSRLLEPVYGNEFYKSKTA